MNNQTSQKNQGWLATIKESIILLLIVFIIRTFGFGLYQVPTESMETTMLVGERFFADKFSYLFKDPQRNDIIAMNDPTFDYSSNTVVRSYQEYVGWPIWPFGPANWTKRVIGIPGDHIEGKIEDGKPVVYRNGEKLDEPYLNKYPILAVNVGEGISLRSYDPSKSDKDQPFYRIDEEDPFYPRFEIGVSDEFTLTSDGRLLKEPGKPNIVHPSRLTKHSLGESTWNGSDEFDIKLDKNQYWLMGDNRRGSKDCRFFGPVERRLIHGKIVFRIWSLDSNESWWILDLIKHPIDFWSRMRWNRFFEWLK